MPTRNRFFLLLLGILLLFWGSALADDFIVYPDGIALMGQTVIPLSHHVEVPLYPGVLSSSLFFDRWPQKFWVEPGVSPEPSSQLENHVGKTIGWMFPDGSTEKYELVNAEPVLLRGPLGIFQPPNGVPVLPEMETPSASPVLHALYNEISSPFRLTYQMKGIDWDIGYRVSLAPTVVDIQGVLSLSNALSVPVHIDFLVLFSGTIYRTTPQDQGVLYMTSRNLSMESMAGADSPVQVSDYDLYEMGGPFALPAARRVDFPFFHQQESYRKLYGLEFSSYNPQAQWVPFEQMIEIAELSRPLPAGNVSMYEQWNGKEVLLGEQHVENHAKGDRLQLYFGQTDMLLGKMELVSSTRLTDSMEQTLRVVGKNLSSEMKTVSVRIRIPQDARLQVKGGGYERERADLLRLTFMIPGQGETELQLVLQYSR
ncbi:MAG TPA: hypothetical protein P5560_00815 [Thermotogota bacterium]|nr:hypothetical protein [Thermotogota bacterium]HRW91468.1 hypothetical protein [Thermotogota bacterium]